MENKHKPELGLPPMELAENVSSGNDSYRIRLRVRMQRTGDILRNVILPAMKKTIMLAILGTILMVSIFLTHLILFQNPEDNTISAEVLVMTGEREIPNVTVAQDDINIFIHLKNNNSNSSIRRKRREVKNSKTEPYNSIEDIVGKFNNQDFKRAAEVISKYKKPCKTGNEGDVCKDIVEELHSIKRVKHDNDIEPDQQSILNIRGLDNENIDTENKLISTDDGKKLSNEKESTDSVSKRDTSATTKLLDETKKTTRSMDFIGKAVNDDYTGLHDHQHFDQSNFETPQYEYPLISSIPITDTCLLARLLKQNYPHNQFNLEPLYDTPYLYPPQSPQVPTSYESALYPPWVQSRDSAHIQDMKPHPQDIGIFMQFKSSDAPPTSPNVFNATARESACEVGTVSCGDGDSCIPEDKWCDGTVDCHDVSDEARCSCKAKVDKMRLCDGYFDCPFGEDEMGCHGCDEDSFSCENLDLNLRGSCFTREQRCNGVRNCPNHKDEMECNMLAPSLHDKPLFAVSLTEGFLQRNFKGNWYAVCKNPYMWAHDACLRETGLILRPPLLQLIPIDPLLKISYINSGPNGAMEMGDTCFNNSAVYVTCPNLLCGTRVLTTSALLRENADVENRLFGREKRYLCKHGHPELCYMDRVQRQASGYSRSFAHGGRLLNVESGIIADDRLKRADTRVVGGKASNPAAWPWMVAMYRDGSFHCGGVVITQSWTVSAAHCVTKFWEHYFEIKVGMLRRMSFSPQEQNHKVTHIIVNQYYNTVDMKNDLCLLKVKPAIQFSRWVRPICLPGEDTAGKDWVWGPPAGTICTAVGWGATVEQGPDPDHMREVEVPIWSHCTHIPDRAGKEICAGFVEGGKDTCQGDSGGPLLCRNPLNSQQWYMAGIVSHGEGCARENEPGVYTRVSLFVKWIRYHINSKTLPTIRPKQECPGFRCVSGVTKCIPKKRMCDKIIDCLGGEDEIGCNYMRSSQNPNENILITEPNNDDVKRNYYKIKMGLDKNRRRTKILPKTEAENVSIREQNIPRSKESINSDDIKSSDHDTGNVFESKSESKEEMALHFTTTELLPETFVSEEISTTDPDDFFKSQEARDSFKNDELITTRKENSIMKTTSIIVQDIEIIPETKRENNSRDFEVSEDIRLVNLTVKTTNNTKNIGISEDSVNLNNLTVQSTTETNNTMPDIGISKDSVKLDNLTVQSTAKTNNNMRDNGVSEDLFKLDNLTVQSTTNTNNIMPVIGISEDSVKLDSLTVQSTTNSNNIMPVIGISEDSVKLDNLTIQSTTKTYNNMRNIGGSEDSVKLDNLTVQSTTKTINNMRNIGDSEDSVKVHNLTIKSTTKINNNMRDIEVSKDSFKLDKSTVKLTTQLPVRGDGISIENLDEKVHTNNKEQVVTEQTLSVDLRNITTAVNINKNNSTVNQEGKELDIELLEDELEKKTPVINELNKLINDLNLKNGGLEPAKVKKTHYNPHYFECKRISQIVPYTRRCDHTADCEDGTDEFGCSCVDYISTFDSSLLCDGQVDCGDGQDEINCYGCSEEQFLCKWSQTCLPLRYVCDGTPQCPQGEDELDCYALTNGKNIIADFDGRPKVNLEGFLTKRHQNNWNIVCEDNLSFEQQEEAANHICRYLGFSSSNRFIVKYINMKENNIINADKFKRRRDAFEIPIQFTYKESLENATARHIVIKEPEVIKETCVPNVTKICMSLYVFCERNLFTDFGDMDLNQFMFPASRSENKMFPWIAKVYVEGEYRCTGILIDLSWVIISESCLWDTLLIHHYVSVALGSHRTLSSTSGPYEQIYQVDAKKDIYSGRMTLLHLKDQAHYSVLVKPMITSSFNPHILGKTDMCVAVGQDPANNTVTVYLEETMNCRRHNRCFKRLFKDSVCNGSYAMRPWSGIISCHAEQGWYPAATFVEQRGECGFEGTLVANDVESLRLEIKHYIAKYLGKSNVSSSAEQEMGDICSGQRCSRGRCIHLREVCDGVRHCEDGVDESQESCERKQRICSKDLYHRGCECTSGQMKCRNGRCVAKELFGDERDDCGDESDEPKHKTCAQYLARVAANRLCDGILHCADRTDEDPGYCKCFSRYSYKCDMSGTCVAPDLVCDGIADCPNGEDERTCSVLRGPTGTPFGTGEVIVRTHGIWHSKCYATANHTRSELEEICKQLGFQSGHAKQLKTPENLQYPRTKVVLDTFASVVLNNNTNIALRNSDKPIASVVNIDDKEQCHPVFIECL